MPETEEQSSDPLQFEELPDAPPKRRLKFSWTGKLGISVVIFWIVMFFLGPFIAPYHEADILDEALFVVPKRNMLVHSRAGVKFCRK